MRITYACLGTVKLVVILPVLLRSCDVLSGLADLEGLNPG
jgi:hypothetical protein